jgi:non-ribosomal peptide synthetase component F
MVKVLKSGASVFLEYRNSFVPTEQAKNIASTVGKLFSELLTSPKVAIGSVDFLSERNQHQLEKWNSKPLPDVQKTIHEAIYENVLATPNAEAVCAWDGDFSYETLDEHACRLATHLQNLGIGAEVIVPLCFDKSKWNMVAVLATLYAGGACKSAAH